jgi:hypothetical protein
MAIRVSVNSIPTSRVSINTQQRSSVRTVLIPVEDFRDNRDALVNLTDVDASDVDNNETLVYDEQSGKFVIKTLPIIDGGTF